MSASKEHTNRIALAVRAAKKRAKERRSHPTQRKVGRTADGRVARLRSIHFLRCRNWTTFPARFEPAAPFPGMFFGTGSHPP